MLTRQGWVALILTVLAAIPTTAPAQTTSAVPLSRLLGTDRPVRLEGAQAEVRASLPVPALMQPTDVALELVGEVSQALIPSSQLVVEVNGHPVFQRRLGGGETALRERITIPPRVLKAGYNDLRVAVAQHHTERCEYPLAPELWTSLDVASSRLVVQADARAVPTRLDRLDAVFDRLAWDERPTVPILTPRAPSADVLSAMGLVAQAVGQRYDYVPVRLTTGRWRGDTAASRTVPGDARGAVVLGTFSELASLLQGLGVPTDRGPVAVLRRMPGDDTRFVLMLAAQREAELPRVAAALAMPRTPWPDRHWAAVRELRMPPLGSVTGAAATLKPSTNAYPLSALGYRTTTFQGMNSQGASLQVWNAAWQGRVQARIHATYASGMSPRSAVNLLVNGNLQGSIPLSNAAGGGYDNYAVSIPAGALRPGWNTLALRPVLIPDSHGGECQPFTPGNLAVTIHEDSTLQTFGGSPLRQPDLALLARDGRPLPQAPVGVGMAVQLTDNQDATVAAGLTLMARLTQAFVGPTLRTEFIVGPSRKASNRLWVGPLSALPREVRDAGGLEEPDLLDAPVPLIRSATVPVLEGGQGLRALRDQLDARGAGPTVVAAGVTLQPGLAGRTAASTWLMGSDVVTVFTAPDHATLETGIAHVVGHGPWSQLEGSLALWRAGEDHMQTVSAEDAPFTAYSLRGGLGLWISQYPWWALLVLTLILVLSVWLTREALAVYRRRHLPPQPAERRDDKGPR